MSSTEARASTHHLWGPRKAPRALRIAAFAGLFTAAGYVGRATIVDDAALSLVWPAAGVAVLWYLVEDVRWRSLDVVALAGITFLVNASTGSGSAMGYVFIVVNVVQALVVVALCRRWGARLWGDGPPISSTRSLMVLVAAAAAGCAVGTTLGVTGLWFTHDVFSVAGTLTWWGRNAVGIIGVTVAGLLLLHRQTSPIDARHRRRRPVRWWVELSATLAVTALLYVLELVTDGAPVSFLLPAVLVWVGMRFSPTVAALQGLLAGAGFVAVTLTGSGAFASVESVQYAALLSQLFVAISVVIGMVLAIYRAETTRLLGEVRRARRASDAQADVLATVISSMSEGVCVLDSRGIVRMANPAIERTLGVAAGPGASGHEALVLLGPDGAPLAERDQPAERALAGEVVANADYVVRRASGSRVVSVFATPLGEAGDQGAVVVLRDVTDEREHHRELAGFAGVVAHDLLNPIGTADGWAEHLADTISEGRGEEGGVELRMVDKIRASTGRMRALVQDLLAHATSADRTLRPERLDLVQMTEDIASERGVPERVRVGEVLPVEGDPVLVRQLLDNLIGNAVKYVAPGSEPELEVAGRPAPGGLVAVTVADRGIGIPDGQHDAVFGDFQRAHASEYQGTGLGLAICRRIVERHGGAIGARPREGGGTVMELTLPAAAAVPRRDRPAVGSGRRSSAWTRSAADGDPLALHPCRRALMVRLLGRRSPMGVTELASATDMSPQLLNKHATTLERAGLITREPAGRERQPARLRGAAGPRRAGHPGRHGVEHPRGRRLLDARGRQPRRGRGAGQGPPASRDARRLVSGTKVLRTAGGRRGRGSPPTLIGGRLGDRERGSGRAGVHRSLTSGGRPMRLGAAALLCAALAAGCSADPAAEAGDPGEAIDRGDDVPGDSAVATSRVATVVDGDTLRLDDGRTVRLVGIDTPERGECGYGEATRRLARLVDGERVSLRISDEDTDRYGRLLRYVDVGSTDAGLELIEDGLAVARYDSRDGYGRHPRQSAYVRADASSPNRCGGG